jgi:hypothetical protein
MPMRKVRVIKDDGRYLILYSFTPTKASPRHPRPPRPHRR